MVVALVLMIPGISILLFATCNCKMIFCYKIDILSSSKNPFFISEHSVYTVLFSLSFPIEKWQFMSDTNDIYVFKKLVSENRNE